MPGPVADAHPDTHTDRIIHTHIHTDAHPYAHTDAEPGPDQGAHMDRDTDYYTVALIRKLRHFVAVWGDDPTYPGSELDATRDVVNVCRELVAYVNGGQQRDSDAEPGPEWVNELVANVRRAADAAERIAEHVCYLQPEPEPDLDPEFGVIHRAYRLGWDAGAAAGKHRSQ